MSQSAPAPPASGQGRLIVYGDIALFQPPGHPENCILRNRFKRGDPVGFRMFVADPSTGKREESAQLVVHLNVGGRTVDIPMRYRATAAQPEREFWVAKWVVPQETRGRDRSIHRDRDGQIRTHRRIQTVRGAGLSIDDRRVTIERDRLACNLTVSLATSAASRPSTR